MTDSERQLLELLKERSFTKGSFTLASGKKSDYYIDVRMTTMCPLGAWLVGEVLHQRIIGTDAVAVGGPAVGAVPLVTAIVLRNAPRSEKYLEGFFVRDQAKGHGTEKLIEGKLTPGDKVVIVEDVVTSGVSALKACKAVRDYGCEVVKVLALVDRGAASKWRFYEEGLDFEAVFTGRDLGADGA